MKKTQKQHTYVGFEYKNGTIQETVTRLDPNSVRLLITGTTRDQRFIAIDSLLGTIDIFNLDNVVNATIAVHDDDFELDDEDDEN